MTSESVQFEQTRRTETFDALEQLEGFKKLTEKQQRMIRMSLYVQDRAERVDLPKGDYERSREHADLMYCHVAAYCLENELATKDPFNDFREYETAKKVLQGATEISRGMIIVKNASIEDAKELIEKTGFPCIVSIGSPLRGSDGTSYLHHTFVALGKNEKGEIIGWEKAGERLESPYRLPSLERIYTHYVNRAEDWGARPLKIT